MSFTQITAYTEFNLKYPLDRLGTPKELATFAHARLYELGKFVDPEFCDYFDDTDDGDSSIMRLSWYLNLQDNNVLSIAYNSKEPNWAWAIFDALVEVFREFHSKPYYIITTMTFNPSSGAMNHNPYEYYYTATGKPVPLDELIMASASTTTPPADSPPEDDFPLVRPASEVPKPIVHLNGTGRETLLREYKFAYKVANAALAALSDITFHQRDYYPGAGYPQTWETALQERQRHLRNLSDARDYLMDHVISLMAPSGG